MRTLFHTRERGFTMTEVLITVTIVAITLSLVIVTLSGSLSKTDVDRATQLVYDDMIYIRARSISTNQTHRLNFSANNQWRIEVQDPTTLAWSSVSDIRRMPTNTNLTPTTFANAGTNLWATPRGLYQFQGTSTGTPYVTITALGVAKTKTINVDVGGAIDIVNN